MVVSWLVCSPVVLISWSLRAVAFLDEHFNRKIVILDIDWTFCVEACFGIAQDLVFRDGRWSSCQGHLYHSIFIEC